MAQQRDQPEPSAARPAASPAELAGALLPRNLGVKVGMLIAFTVMVIGGFIVYVLFARGVFEQTQRVYLIAENAEGVGVGTDLTFAGFPVGRVRRITLRDDGKVRISVRVPVSETKWLRESSVFVLEVPLVGGAKGAAAPPHPQTWGPRRLRTAPNARCCAATPPRRFPAWSLRCGRCWRTWTS